MRLPITLTRAQGDTRGRGGQHVTSHEASSPGFLVIPGVAKKQLAAEILPLEVAGAGDGATVTGTGQRSGVGPGAYRSGSHGAPTSPVPTQPSRFHGSVTLDATRVGRDAGKIAGEVIAHLAGLVCADVTVTLEIQADLPTGTPDNVVRTVTENCRTLRFSEGAGLRQREKIRMPNGKRGNTAFHDQN